MSGCEKECLAYDSATLVKGKRPMVYTVAARKIGGVRKLTYTVYRLVYIQGVTRVFPNTVLSEIVYYVIMNKKC